MFYLLALPLYLLRDLPPQRIIITLGGYRGIYMSAQFGTPPPDFNALFFQVLTNAQELRRQVESNIKPKTNEDRRIVNKYYADLDELIEQTQRQQQARPTPPDNVEVEAIERIIQLIGEQVFESFYSLPFASTAYGSDDRNNPNYYNTKEEINRPLFQLLYLTVNLKIALFRHFQSQVRNRLRRQEEEV
jgi:hypothetical protein